MTIAEVLTNQFIQESKLTRKMLERVPFDNTEWKPHEKSMTIQRLASHIAEIPSLIGEVLEKPGRDFGPVNPNRFFAKDREELLLVFEEKLAENTPILRAATDELLASPWNFLRNGVTVMTFPRVTALHNLVFNHIIHHRGQLSVYLRLNEVEVPGMYGPSFDDRQAMAAKS